MQYLLDLFGVRVLVALAITAAYIAGFVALQLAIFALYTGLSFALPPSMQPVLGYVLALLPSNFDACATALISARLAKWLWNRQQGWMQSIGRSA